MMWLRSLHRNIRIVNYLLNCWLTYNMRPSSNDSMPINYILGIEIKLRIRKLYYRSRVFHAWFTTFDWIRHWRARIIRVVFIILDHFVSINLVLMDLELFNLFSHILLLIHRPHFSKKIWLWDIMSDVNQYISARLYLLWSLSRNLIYILTNFDIVIRFELIENLL